MGRYDCKLRVFLYLFFFSNPDYRIMRTRGQSSVDYDIGEHYMYELKEGVKYG